MPPKRATRDRRDVRRRSDDGGRRAYDEQRGEEGYDEEPGEEAYDEAEPGEVEPADEDQAAEAAAEREADAGRRPRRGGARPGHARDGRKTPGRVTAAQAAEAGLRNLMELIGKKPLGVTSLEPTEDGWLVGVEVLEDERVPSSADILAVYEAELDPDGGLLSYHRSSRYTRGRGDTSRES
jgi:hypothetical protein